MLLIGGLVLLCMLPAISGRHTRISSTEETDTSTTQTKETEFDEFSEISGNSTDKDAGAQDNDVNTYFHKTGDRFYETLNNLSMYLPINVKYVYEKSKDCDIIHNNKSYYEKVPLIISAVLIVLGVIFCFFGYRLIQIVLFLIGFLIGFAALYILIISFTHSRPEHWIPYVALSVAALVGLLAGLLTVCVYQIGIFLGGGSIGFLATWFLLAAINVTYLREHIYIPIIIALVVMVIVGILALVLQKWLFIIGTSILGSFIAVWGLDYYLELGAMIYYLFLFAENRSSIKPCWYSWIVLVLFVILILAGFLIQALVTGRKFDHKKVMKGVCCGLCKRKKKDVKSAPDGKADYMKLKQVSEDKN